MDSCVSYLILLIRLRVLIFFGLTTYPFSVLLFTSLSLPIIKSLYIMKASFTLANGKKGDIRFGVWGACVYGVAPTEMGFSGVNYFGQCTKQGLGWTTLTVYVTDPTLSCCVK